MIRLLLILLFAAATTASAQQASKVPEDAQQLLVAIAKDWNSDRAMMWAFNRNRDGSWETAFEKPVAVLLGRTGLAWGRGVIPAPKDSNAPHKREGDRKTPAGLFAIGKMFGYPEKLPNGAKFPYRQVGRYDAWVDDPKNKYYNQHYIAKPGSIPSWFESQRMRLGDFAYKYKIEIQHNTDPAVPGQGSAIFFHIRRGPDRPTAGCTTMTEGDLTRVITWLNDKKDPHYVVLPKAEYDRVQASWDLPEFR